VQAEGGSAHRDTRAVNGDDGALACQAHGPDRGGIRILENRAGLAAGDELSARRVAAVEKRFSYDLQTVLSRRLGDLARHSEDRQSSAQPTRQICHSGGERRRVRGIRANSVIQRTVGFDIPDVGADVRESIQLRRHGAAKLGRRHRERQPAESGPVGVGGVSADHHPEPGSPFDSLNHGVRVSGVTTAGDVCAGDDGEKRLVVSGRHPVDRFAEVGVQVDGRHATTVRPVYGGCVARAHVEAPPPQVRLSDGSVARIVPSAFASGWELEVGGTPQSHVDLADPTHLHFEYVARMGAVIDQLGEPGEPLTAIHLGAGAYTLPRYVEATRPGSRQQVIELEPALVSLVREHLPLPSSSRAGGSIRTRTGDARAVLERLPAGIRGQADLVISDIFHGARTPAHVTSLEFYCLVARYLTETGVLLVNVADGAGLAFARRQAATVRSELPHVALLAEVQVLKGRRFGNIVIAASRTPLPTAWLPRLMAAGPHPAKVAQGAEIDAFVAGSRPVTDADAAPSPAPSATLFER
jgi:hypothetical protein